jgi:hypothetical protein
MTISGFLSGILLGLGAAVPIGPVNVEIARRSLPPCEGVWAAGYRSPWQTGINFSRHYDNVRSGQELSS